MPDIASYHPQIVHFVIALLVTGVVLRLVALSGRLAFTGPAATTLLVVGTLASLAAVRSGDDAHGPVERVPGARAAVVDHETWGIRTRNVFVIVALVDLAALAFAWRQHRFARPAGIAAAATGVIGLVFLYQAASHGSELVYGYAGGVGIRSGRPEDIERLLVAGVYHQASLDREAGKGVESWQLVDVAARRFPQNVELQLMEIEWRIAVRNDPGSALQRLEALSISPGETRLRIRAGLLRAQALAAAGNVDGARAVLETLRSEFPANRQIQQQLSELGGGVARD
ncbi:MAG: tetratricopeptide repeat protein [Acidobacteria bacterium]|nr:tetratricopeptide repeat protein [Acidobacteriota bacterium]